MSNILGQAPTQFLGTNPLIGTMMQQGVPLGQQVTPSSTNFQPDLQFPPAPPLPNKSPMSAMGPMPTNPPSTNPMNVKPPSMVSKPSKNMPAPGSESEAQSIIRILGERALALTRMEEKAHGEQIKQTRPEPKSAK